MKLLIIEDDNSLREIMLRALKGEGYIVETASTFFEAEDKIAGYSYDCIMLDIMLPDGNGLKLLEHIKSLGKEDRVIIISARDSLEDKIAGLDLGADDYLPKPFAMSELLARVKAMLRRRDTYHSDLMTFAGMTLDQDKCTLSVGPDTCTLNRREYG